MTLVTCPECHHSFPLTEALIEHLLEERLRTERSQIAADETRKARQLLANDLEKRTQEILQLNASLKERDGQLQKAQQLEVEIQKRERPLKNDRAEFEQTVARTVQAQATAMREEAQKKSDAKYGLQLTDLTAKLAQAEKMQASAVQKAREIAEKETELAIGLQTEELRTQRDAALKEATELKRKLEQGSVQAQGEVQEQVLEELMRLVFPFDRFDAVPAGKSGADYLQTVITQRGLECGSALVESKRTKAWQNE